jgi:hypothetical protein
MTLVEDRNHLAVCVRDIECPLLRDLAMLGLNQLITEIVRELIEEEESQ